MDKESMDKYRDVIECEKLLAAEEHELSPSFTVKVMDGLEEDNPNFIRRLIMDVTTGKRTTIAAVVTTAVIVLCLSLQLQQPVDQGAIEVYNDEWKRLSEPLEEAKKDSDKAVAIKPQNAPAVKNEIKVLPLEQRPVAKSKPRHPAAGLADLEAAIGTGAPTTLRDTYSAKPLRERLKRLPADLLGRRQVFEDREVYEGYQESERTNVRSESVSTFSIDVDTGSYTNARRYLRQGILPPKDSVRIEEFINYFDYDYPTQTEKPFNLTYEIAPSPLDSERYFLRLGLKARDVEQSDKPWNLTFLVDVSGSMSSPDKLELVKRALKVLVGEMRPEDKVSLVTYAGSAGVALEATSIKDKEKILTAIERLGAGGSTYGSAGIKMAYDENAKNRIDNGVNRVVLATDGDFNVGITSRNELIKLIEEKRRSGITLTTVGVGQGNIQEATMEQLANKGNGNYFYLDSFKEARKVFKTDLAGTMEVVAKDVKLQIEFNPEHVVEYRLVGYDNRVLRNQDFNNDKIDAGEIGSGHTVTALYEIVLAGSELAEKLKTEHRYKAEADSPKLKVKKGFGKELAFLKIRHKEPNGSKSKLSEIPILASAVKKKTSDASADFNFVSAVTYFGQYLRGSDYEVDKPLAEVIKLAESGVGEDSHGYRREFIELLRNAEAIKR